MFKKREILQFSQDRLALSLLIVLFVGVLFVIITTAFNVRVSDVQVPTRYSGYGFTNVYRDKWYVLLSFGIFAMLAGFVNSYLAVKLHSVRRSLSISILSISIVIILICVIVSSAVFRLAAFSL